MEKLIKKIYNNRTYQAIADVILLIATLYFGVVTLFNGMFILTDIVWYDTLSEFLLEHISAAIVYASATVIAYIGWCFVTTFSWIGPEILDKWFPDANEDEEESD